MLTRHHNEVSCLQSGMLCNLNGLSLFWVFRKFRDSWQSNFIKNNESFAVYFERFIKLDIKNFSEVFRLVTTLSVKFLLFYVKIGVRYASLPAIIKRESIIPQHLEAFNLYNVEKIRLIFVMFLVSVSFISGVLVAPKIKVGVAVLLTEKRKIAVLVNALKVEIYSKVLERC